MHAWLSGEGSIPVPLAPPRNYTKTLIYVAIFDGSRPLAPQFAPHNFSVTNTFALGNLPGSDPGHWHDLGASALKKIPQIGRFPGLSKSKYEADPLILMDRPLDRACDHRSFAMSGHFRGNWSSTSNSNQSNDTNESNRYKFNQHKSEIDHTGQSIKSNRAVHEYRPDLQS